MIKVGDRVRRPVTLESSGGTAQEIMMTGTVINVTKWLYRVEYEFPNGGKIRESYQHEPEPIKDSLPKARGQYARASA